jgi:uncharacterized protein
MQNSEFLELKSKVLKRMTIGLDPKLTYHSPGHTKDVLRQAERIAEAENIKDPRLLLLIKIAALFHDTGFLYTYKEHEKKSCEIMLETIDKNSFEAKELELMKGMIMATKVPQQPHSLLEMILCDADLDYLGRDDFDPISDQLKKEFTVYDIIQSEEQWDQLQVSFFESHHYFTATSIRSRQPLKMKHLETLKQKLLKSKL